jgi:3-hydroxybutyrate dehydrogenase
LNCCNVLGRNALITGSVRGLGLAIARALARAGCNVTLNGFDPDGDITGIMSALEAEHGVRVRYAPADLRVPQHILAMVADADAAFGSVDVVVNNAVVRHLAPCESFPAEAWDESLAVNLSAAFHTTRAALPGMKARRWGRIINVSSIYGLRGTINRVGYVTTKTALIGLTRAIALETVKDGITCNALCPGTTDTPIHQHTIDSAMTTRELSREDAEREFFSGKQPSGRFIAADGVASLAAFLCSDDARDITGAVLPVDSGWSAG